METLTICEEVCGRDITECILCWWYWAGDWYQWWLTWCVCTPSGPCWKPLLAADIPSSGFIMSDITPDNERHPGGPPPGPTTPPDPFFFFDLELNLRFRVWIPSFFIVSGRFTCNNGKIEKNNYFIVHHTFSVLYC